MSYSINYVYQIRDRFSSVMGKMAKATGKFDKTSTKMHKSLSRIEDKFKSTGAKLANLQTGLASLGAGAFLKGALDENIEFQKKLNMTKAVTGATAQQMDLLRNKALEWGSSTQFSSKQVAGAMAELGKMGNKTNEILDLMPGTMALAAAGEISMAEAANYSMGILNQFGMALGQAGNVADILATGASISATSVAGLASAMNNTGLQASMAGLSIEDTTAALAAMAKKNMEGSEAGTMMMNALKQLQVMPSKVRKGFEGMGIDIDKFRDATTGQMTDFFGLIGAMKDAGATGAQLGQMFDVRSMKAMAILVETNTDDLNSYRDAVSKSTGASKEMADTLKEGLNPLIEFESVMQNLKVIVGGFVATAISPLLEKFNSWMGNMQQNNPEMLKMITYFLMGVTAVGAILIPLGLLISSLGTIIGVLKMATIVTKIFSITQALMSGAFGLSGVSIATTTAATRAYLIGAKIAGAATKIWTGIQTAFNLVMAGNPIALIVLAVIALGVWFAVLYKKTGSVSEAFKVMGSVVLNVLLAPIQLLLFGLESLMGLMSKIPGVGHLFEGATQGLGDMRESIKGLRGDLGSSLDQFKEIPEYGYSTGATDSQIGTTEQAPGARYSQGANANAEASVKVYTEKDMKAVPFESSDNLGYNMSDSYSRGM